MAQEQETKETKDIQAEIARPHGREQQVKMEILDMIHRGESPYDIIYHVAKWLEDVSGVMWSSRSARFTAVRSSMRNRSKMSFMRLRNG